VPRIFEILADKRIEEALARGELESLPGSGKPLIFEDDPFTSPEQRMMNRILKQAGFTPAEVTLRKAVAELRETLVETPAGPERKALEDKLALSLLQLAEASRCRD